MRDRKTMGLLLAVLLAAIIVIGGRWYLSSVQESLWMQSVTSVMEVTSQGSHAFEVFMEKDMEMLHGLTLNLEQKLSDDEASIMNRLLAFGETGANYSVVDLDHGILYSSQNGEDNIRCELTDDELAAYEGFSGRGIEEPYLSRDTGQKMLGYYECFQFADGTRGIIQKEQLLSNIAEKFSLSFYNDTGFSYVVSQKGDILIRSSHRNSNRTFSNVFDVIDLDGNSSKALEGFRTAMAEGKSGVARFYNGPEEYVYAYEPLDDTDGWYLISIIPNSVIMKQGNQILNSSQIFVMLIVGTIAIFASFGLLLWRSHKDIMEVEQEVKYREQLFSILANNTDSVFIMFTAEDYKVEYISPNVERVLGISQEDIKADVTVLKRLRATEENTVSYEALEQMETGSSIMKEGERIHRKTGEQLWFAEIVYRVVIEEKDKYIAFLSDRTMDKKRERALEQAVKIAEVANQSKSTFLSNMSHDIRTPMNAIVGLCTLLQKDADKPSRVRDYTRKITASSQHLLGLINDVLDMSKIESGKTTLNVSEINLAEIIEELGTIIRPQAKAKQQLFDIAVFGVQTEHLLGDKLRINQIMINILSNAVKYTQEGGQIEMSVRQMPQTTKNYANLRFEIKDNGMGMSKECQETIFEPFTREVSSTINQIQGTGLGMAITKNLVELMGGTIKVESELGKGSTFTVDLELRIQDEDIDQDFWKKYGLTHALIVDDEVEMCTSIVSAMAGTGVSMQFTVDGMSAVRMVEKAHKDGRDFNLVLLDWKMPGMNGIETARRIREIIPADVPVMILTAHDWSEIEEEAVAAGIDGFLPKPFFLSNFRLTIEKLMDQKENRRKPGAKKAENPLAGKHILAAEDNELNSEILVELLDMMGATCDVAVNGKEALERFRQSGPGEYDLILMDVQMPVMNGYEATREIRMCGHPKAASVPIIAMTANAFAEDIRNALNAGMDAHVAKPVDIERLCTIVSGILEKREQSAE